MLLPDLHATRASQAKHQTSPSIPLCAACVHSTNIYRVRLGAKLGSRY